MAYPLLWYDRPPTSAINTRRSAADSVKPAQTTCLLSAIATWAAEFYPTVFTQKLWNMLPEF